MRLIPEQSFGPAQALWARRVQVTTPGAFCAALLGKLRYTLPADVPTPTWQVAVRHFAERQPTEAEFRRLLERRATRVHGTGDDPGARVAAYLLREWERYQLARQVAPAAPDRRPSSGAGAPGRRSFSTSRRRDRAAQTALLQRLGVPVPARPKPGKQRRSAPPAAQPDAGG